MALGIGAATAVFSLVYGIFIRPYPVPRTGPPGTVQKRIALAEISIERSSVTAFGEPVSAAIQRHGPRHHSSRQEYTIAGVMPPGFAFSEKTSIWTTLESYDARRYPTVARLVPRKSISRAQSELTTIAEQLDREYPGTNDGFGQKLRKHSACPFGYCRYRCVDTALGEGKHYSPKV